MRKQYQDGTCSRLDEGRKTLFWVLSTNVLVSSTARNRFPPNIHNEVLNFISKMSFLRPSP